MSHKKLAYELARKNERGRMKLPVPELTNKERKALQAYHVLGASKPVLKARLKAWMYLANKISLVETGSLISDALDELLTKGLLVNMGAYVTLRTPNPGDGEMSDYIIELLTDIRSSNENPTVQKWTPEHVTETLLASGWTPEQVETHCYEMALYAKWDSMMFGSKALHDHT